MNYQSLKKTLSDIDNRLVALMLAVTLIVLGAILYAFGFNTEITASLALSGSILAFLVSALSCRKLHHNDKELRSCVCKIIKEFEEQHPTKSKDS